MSEFNDIITRLADGMTANYAQSLTKVAQILEETASDARARAFTGPEAFAFSARLMRLLIPDLPNPHQNDASPGAAIARRPPVGTAAPVSNSEEDCHGS